MAVGAGNLVLAGNFPTVFRLWPNHLGCGNRRCGDNDAIWGEIGFYGVVVASHCFGNFPQRPTTVTPMETSGNLAAFGTSQFKTVAQIDGCGKISGIDQVAGVDFTPNRRPLGGGGGVSVQSPPNSFSPSWPGLFRP